MTHWKLRGRSDFYIHAEPIEQHPDYLEGWNEAQQEWEEHETD
jgi:hypothetical protein